MVNQKIAFIDPLGHGRSLLGHKHFMRDWTGATFPGYLPFPPLDLMYAAAYVRERGFDVRIIESNINHWTHQRTIKEIKLDPPQFILIPSTYFTLEDDRYLSMLIRSAFPETRIIFSGPLLTHDPSLVLKDNSADFVALGELEDPILNILKGQYSENIAYKNANNIVIGKRTLLDLNNLPIPARDLIQNNAYKYFVFNRGNPITAMTLSRGCPHSKCKFCHTNLYTLGQHRFRSVDSIIKEIYEVKFKYGIGEIFFRDQVFTANKNIVRDVCDYMISEKINLYWRAQTRVDFVDSDIFKLMHRAGCYQLSFGLESSSQDMLDSINKGITLAQAEEAIKCAKDAGIEVLGLFILGMPGDKEELMKETIDFAIKSGIEFANFNEICFFPGTEITDNYARDGAQFTDYGLLRKYTINAYLRFYLRLVYLKKNIFRLKSFKNIGFLIMAGLREMLSHLGERWFQPPSYEK